MRHTSWGNNEKFQRYGPKASLDSQKIEFFETLRPQRHGLTCSHRAQTSAILKSAKTDHFVGFPLTKFWKKVSPPITAVTLVPRSQRGSIYKDSRINTPIFNSVELPLVWWKALSNTVRLLFIIFIIYHHCAHHISRYIIMHHGVTSSCIMV